MSEGQAPALGGRGRGSPGTEQERGVLWGGVPALGGRGVYPRGSGVPALGEKERGGVCLRGPQGGEGCI